MNKAVTFGERLAAMMFWTVAVIILAGFVLHFASSRGLLPGLTSWIGAHANLAAQAGA